MQTVIVKRWLQLHASTTSMSARTITEFLCLPLSAARYWRARLWLSATSGA